jgi:hypothetical protein
MMTRLSLARKKTAVSGERLQRCASTTAGKALRRSST